MVHREIFESMSNLVTFKLFLMFIIIFGNRVVLNLLLQAVP